MKLLLLAGASALFFLATSPAQNNLPPAGFTALFNGQDLTGWRGGDTFDHRKVLAATPEMRAAIFDQWTKAMLAVNPQTGRPHWTVEAGELVNDGLGAYAATVQDYGDFELLVEYKTVPLADSGIYLRGVPQVQIWDSTEPAKFPVGGAKGSGGLWNNSPGAPGKDPLERADRPFGEWNRLRILMVGARVSVWLNNRLTVDHALLENYYDRSVPVPRRGPILLQTHGGEIRWRNIFLREIASEEANQLLAGAGAEGFKPLWNGRDFTGWGGPVEQYEIRDGAIVCRPGQGGTIFAQEELTDFVARVEFRLPPGGNNGLALRYPGQGDPAYDGMGEVQVLDDDAAKYAGLDPRQFCGSLYGLAAAHRGYVRPAGEWNFYEITVRGPLVRVELNGTVITAADVSKITPGQFLAARPHPGKDRTSGFLGFAGHDDPVAFRSVFIKKL